MINNDNHLTEVLNQLKIGSLLTKQKINGKKFPRRFFLDQREDFISYNRLPKGFNKPRIYSIKDIDEVRAGFRAETFHRLLERGIVKSIDEPRAFTILYDNHQKEEHLIATDVNTRDLWIEGLEYLTNRHAQETQCRLIENKDWILKFFYAADKNRSNTLTKKECRDLLIESFHVKIPHHIFERMFNEADKTNEGVLNAEEFITFFHLLTHRKDLYEIMKKYTKSGTKQSIETIYMNTNELSSLLNIKPEQTQNFINEFEMNIQLREKGLLSLDGLRNMLLSENFDIINSSRSRQIYQDMTRPLCHYYINTSHNTYLFHSQISGDSNPEAYNQVLFMGCRAVELDCYDGDHGSPIVTHAHTLVKPCSFESIIRSIEPNLFKTSPYPVILNIENHCSSEQQRQMARILKNILGDQLITKPLSKKDPSILPSPEDLKHKVLVRSKKTSKSTKIQEEDDDDHSPLNPDVHPELAELFVYLQNVPYRDYGYAKIHYSSFHSSSLAENHFFKHAQYDPIGLVRQTTWRLLRLYPDGFRQDSSNPYPIHAWNSGLQMVALNYQHHDHMTALCYGKFLDNGGCGYILKPNYLLNAETIEFNPWNCQKNFDNPLTLTITIISGQFLPQSNHKTLDIPDPYVRISTHGLTGDEHVKKTKVIRNNGFDPIWNETFQFRIRFPQLCLVYFSVIDHDVVTHDNRLAYFCSPVTMIQTGYRHIYLRANNNDITYSTLFVHIDIQHDNDEDIIRTRF